MSDSCYWVVHGKSYDLTSFVEHHPGGAYHIMVGKGRDCTALFESVHALGATHGKRPAELLQKYLVDPQPPERPVAAAAARQTTVFSWDADGFYATVRRRTQARFSGRSCKATWFVLAKIVVMIAAYIACWVQALASGRWYWAAAAGVATEMVGFCLMHDSSHSALSSVPALNYLGALWSPWMLFNHFLWLQHHVYAHHSFTGILHKDPDVVNTNYVVRKHERTRKMPWMGVQHYYGALVLMIMPNQHLGQALLYQLTPVFGNRLFGLRVHAGPHYAEQHARNIAVLSFVVHVVLPLVLFGWRHGLWLAFLLYTMMGTSYFLNVAPNHDTLSTLQMHPAPTAAADKAIDWGEHQVRTTGNHSNSQSLLDRIITHLWGGMNYQIEHHLFPTANHAHYPEISVIVQQTCKEFGIPYNNQGNWLHAMRGNWLLLRLMAK